MRGPLRRSLLVLFLTAVAQSQQALAFTPFQRRALSSRWKNDLGRQSPRDDSARYMALTPVGPCCPFRSSAAQQMDPQMDKLNTATPELATEMARIQLDMQTGNTPDPDRMRKVAKGINEAVDEWEGLLTRLRLSNDFQTREYAKLTQAHLEIHGMTHESIASMMRWQSACMMAIADNVPPPMPPSDVDLMKIMEQSQQPPPSIAAMTAAGSIAPSNPFTGQEDVFDSPTVREEYLKLCRDHEGLIELGASYANFDPAGKIAYIDEIEKISDRWDVFFARFKLLGKLSKEFTRQCNDLLASMGMNEEQYNELLKKTHQIMRDDAEKERNIMGL